MTAGEKAYLRIGDNSNTVRLRDHSLTLGIWSSDEDICSQYEEQAKSRIKQNRQNYRCFPRPSVLPQKLYGQAYHQPQQGKDRDTKSGQLVQARNEHGQKNERAVSQKS